MQTQEELNDLLDGVAMTTMEFHSEEGPLSIDNLFVSQLSVFAQNGSFYKLFTIKYAFSASLSTYLRSGKG